MSTEQIIADLQATRDKMTPGNWSCEGWEDADGNRCVQAHLIEAIAGKSYGLAKFEFSEYEDRYIDAREALRDHLPDIEFAGQKVHSVGYYNDHCATFEDIQDLIDKTLADLGGL